MLYPPGDLDALTRTCRRLLADPATGRPIGRNAARDMHEHYTWEHNVRRAVALARSLRPAMIEASNMQ